MNNQSIIVYGPPIRVAWPTHCEMPSSIKQVFEEIRVHDVGGKGLFLHEDCTIENYRDITLSKEKRRFIRDCAQECISNIDIKPHGAKYLYSVLLIANNVKNGIIVRGVKTNHDIRSVSRSIVKKMLFTSESSAANALNTLVDDAEQYALKLWAKASQIDNLKQESTKQKIAHFVESLVILKRWINSFDHNIKVFRRAYEVIRGSDGYLHFAAGDFPIDVGIYEFAMHDAKLCAFQKSISFWNDHEQKKQKIKKKKSEKYKEYEKRLKMHPPRILPAQGSILKPGSHRNNH